MGKIIDRVRQRQYLLREKEVRRRMMEADVAFSHLLLGAYGVRPSVAGPIIFIVVCVVFFIWCGYAIFWR